MHVEEFEKKYQEIVKNYQKAIQWDLDEVESDISDEKLNCVYKKTTGIIDWYEFGEEFVLVSNDEIQCVIDWDCEAYSAEDYLKNCESYFSDIEKEMLASV